MALRHDWDDLDAHGQEGDWCFILSDTVMVLRFGDSVDDVAMLRVYRERRNPATLAREDTHPTWEWTGSRETPTLLPSILVHGDEGQPDRWHGYLRDGKLETI